MGYYVSHNGICKNISIEADVDDFEDVDGDDGVDDEAVNKGMHRRINSLTRSVWKQKKLHIHQYNELCALKQTRLK